MTGWLQVFGRLHPLVLHLPIGLLVGLAVVELIALVRRTPQARSASAILAWLAAASAVLVAASGWTLSHEEQYGGETIENHERLGIAVAVGSVLVALLQSRQRLTWAYRAVLLVTIGILLPATHLGATITHGEEFLTEPLRARVEGNPAAVSTYARTIAPIFAARCATCHAETKHKGGLSLHRPDAIRKGGKDGPVLVAGQPEASEMLRRLRLPLEDEDHMPPAEKPQPTAEEIGKIETWIAAGAPFEGEVAVPAASPVTEGDTARTGEKTVTPASAAGLAALQKELVHVQPVEKGSSLLSIDFAAVASRTTDVEAAALLDPVRDQVGDLSLARSKITDATLSLIARMPNLRRLDLRGAPVTDAGLTALGRHARLEDLVLAQTRLSDASVEELCALPALKRVWLWRSGVSPQAVARLREQRPALSVDTGDEPDSAATQVEEKVVLTKGTPAPSAPLTPVNTVCPVSGSPVDPAYTIVFRGKVVGFCCPKCPAQFWADPAKFESKLP